MKVLVTGITEMEVLRTLLLNCCQKKTNITEDPEVKIVQQKENHYKSKIEELEFNNKNEEL